MAYTAQQLISRAWYLSGIVGRSAQTPTGNQVTDGLFMLNALLDFKQIQTALIPYYTYKEDYETVIGQEKYFIANCAEIQSITFNVSTVRYAMQLVSPAKYFGGARVDDIQSLPFNWTFNRTLGGTDVYLYFEPQAAYQLKIYGKYFLTNVTLQTDLTTVYDTSYIEYLRYSLAEYMCSEYGITFNPQSQMKLKQMEESLRWVMPPDLSLKKLTVLSGSGASLTWAQINLGQGWTPGGGA